MPESGKITPETFQRHREGIDFALLPKTLREAVVVTRSLGISLLRLNALRIIQEDRDDRDKESTVMSKVYSRAINTCSFPTASGGDACTE
jgi:hypothetical protein